LALISAPCKLPKFSEAAATANRVVELSGQFELETVELSQIANLTGEFQV